MSIYNQQPTQARQEKKPIVFPIDGDSNITLMTITSKLREVVETLEPEEVLFVYITKANKRKLQAYEWVQLFSYISKLSNENNFITDIHVRGFVNSEFLCIFEFENLNVTLSNEIKLVDLSFDNGVETLKKLGYNFEVF